MAAEKGLGGPTSRTGIPLKRAEGLILVMETPKGDILSDPACSLPSQDRAISHFCHFTDSCSLNRSRRICE